MGARYSHILDFNQKDAALIAASLLH